LGAVRRDARHFWVLPSVERVIRAVRGLRTIEAMSTVCPMKGRGREFWRLHRRLDTYMYPLIWGESLTSMQWTRIPSSKVNRTQHATRKYANCSRKCCTPDPVPLILMPDTRQLCSMSTSQESQTTVSSSSHTSTCEVRNHFFAFVDRFQSSPDEVLSALVSDNPTLEEQEASMAAIGSAVVASGSSERRNVYSECIAGYLNVMNQIPQFQKGVNADADSVRRMLNTVLSEAVTDRDHRTLGGLTTPVSTASYLPDSSRQTLHTLETLATLRIP
jgi:hypothetical protein